MKRALATLGVVGLALLSVSAPAYADDDFKICHNGHVQFVDLSGVNGLHGHGGHSDDIIPPNPLLPAGLNWTVQGMADFANSCGHVTLPPVIVVPPGEEEPPAEENPPTEEQPPTEENPPTGVEPTVVEQPTLVTGAAGTVTPAPQVAAPKGAAAKAPAAKAPAAKTPTAVSKGTNQGFNAQTAAGGTDDSTTWLAGLGVLLGAGAVVAVRRKSRTESPTAG